MWEATPVGDVLFAKAKCFLKHRIGDRALESPPTRGGSSIPLPMPATLEGSPTPAMIQPIAFDRAVTLGSASLPDPVPETLNSAAM